MYNNNDSLTVGLIIKFLDASYKNWPDKKIAGYKLVTELDFPDYKTLCKDYTSEEKQYVKVYYSPTHCVVVHRGTDKSEKMDIYFANCAVEPLAKCKYSETRRYIVSKEIQNWAETKWWPTQITTLGHSQGGLLAALVGQNSKEIIKVQPLHRESYKETEKEITIRSANDFVDKRPVDAAGISDPTKHLYVAVDPKADKTILEQITKKAIYMATGIDVDEHDYTKVLEKVDKKMRIGVNEKIFSERDQYNDMKWEKAEQQKWEGKKAEPTGNMALIKKIGVGALIMGVGYAGYKWYKKNKKKTKQRSSSSSTKLKKTVKRGLSSASSALSTSTRHIVSR
jgi:hypothetical protein